jgi:2-oxoglutarate ferredoxin oxidoreductase subunit gamma
LKSYKEYFASLDRINCRFCGQGGQGIILMAYLFGKAAILSGMNAVQTQKYGPESRGSPVYSDVVLSRNKEIKFPLFKRIDILVGLHQSIYDQNHQKVPDLGLILLDKTLINAYQEDPNTFDMPSTSLAKDQFKKPVLANVILLGYLSKLLGDFIQEEHFISTIKESVREEMVKIDLEAFDFGKKWTR